MIPIRFTVTAVALAAASFFVATLILDAAPQSAAEADSTTTAAEDRAAFVARVAAGLEDEPHMRGRTPALEAATGPPPPPDALPEPGAAINISAATRATLAVAGRPAANVDAATVASTPAPAARSASASPPALRAPAAPPPDFALEATDDWTAALQQGWVAASGSGPATLELRPMPRRR